MSQSSDLGVNLTQQRSPCRRQLANQIDQSGRCLPDEAFQRLIAVIGRFRPRGPCATVAGMQEAIDVVAEVLQARTEIGRAFLSGSGIEVGPGDRPFPIPAAAHILYGDIRKHEALESYFRTTDLASVKDIDAQTFAGIDNDSLDFVISAHVIEHLRDPISSIVNAIRVLKVGGIHVLVVPDMRYTFDRNRPETTVEHVLTDFADGRVSTCRNAYEEHLRYVHPYLTGETYSEADIQRHADENVKHWRAFDCHFHAWSQAGFEALLDATKEFAAFKVEATVFVVNENIFVLRKLAGICS